MSDSTDTTQNDTPTVTDLANTVAANPPAEATDTTPNGPGRGNGTRKATVLSYDPIFVAFYRGEDTTVGKVGFFSLDDEGAPVEIEVSLSWQELRRMSDALDVHAKAEKAGNVAATDARAAEKRAEKIAKLNAQRDKLLAQLAELTGDAQAAALSSDDAILAEGDSPAEDSAENLESALDSVSEDADDPESADNYPREDDADNE